MLYSCGVSSSNEVSDTAVGSGRSVPEDLSRASIIHRRRPDGEDNVVRVEGSIVKKSLVLLHSGVKRDVIILAPSSKGVEQ